MGANRDRGAFASVARGADGRDASEAFLRRLYLMEGEWRYGRKAVPAPSGTADRAEG